MEYEAAIDAYVHDLSRDTSNPEIMWKLARVYVCMGEVTESKDATTFYRKAESTARRCVELDSSSSEGHTWLAGALGYLALESGVGDQVNLSRELNAELEKALRFNPRNDAAYSIKGSFHRALGNISWFQRQIASIFVGSVPQGGYEEAEKALRLAIALAPDIMRHQYELGVLYLDMGREDEAKSVLEHAATLPVKVAIDSARVKKIEILLRDLQNQ